MNPIRPTFADLEAQGARRRTRKAEFLGRLDAEVPWGRLLALLGPACPEGRRGRPPVGAERMPRTCLPAVRCGLSDEAAAGRGRRLGGGPGLRGLRRGWAPRARPRRAGPAT